MHDRDKLTAPGVLFMHVKTKKFYQIVTRATIEATMTPAIVYKDHVYGGPVWVRPEEEFFDGRFELVSLDHSENDEWPRSPPHD